MNRIKRIATAVRTRIDELMTPENIHLVGSMLVKIGTALMDDSRTQMEQRLSEYVKTPAETDAQVPEFSSETKPDTEAAE